MSGIEILQAVGCGLFVAAALFLVALIVSLARDEPGGGR